jgi:hypothetical protein
MTMYRKRPVVVEAFQMTRERAASTDGWPDWLRDAWHTDRLKVGSLFPEKEGTDEDVTFFIRTLEGKMSVKWGSFIIRGVEGELYAIEEGIFAKTYEPVED